MTKTRTDPDFSDLSDKKTGRDVPRWVVRTLIYGHGLAALLTAAFDLLYAARVRGWIGWYSVSSDTRRGVENISMLAFLTVFVFVPAILITARSAGLETRERWWASLATLALAFFQFEAILPEFQ